MTRSNTPCQMMLDGPDGPNPRSCGATPTIGTNGRYRYCKPHMQMVRDAGATTLKWDRASHPQPEVRRLSGWRGAGTRIYTSKMAAYYSIAKRLVVDKYPAWLSSPERDSYTFEMEMMGIDLATAELRAERAAKLFGYADSDVFVFDDRRWKKFVWRVAKFLEFFDRREPKGAKLMRVGDADLAIMAKNAEIHADLEVTNLLAIEAEIERRQNLK